jgi:hypothetical protein
MNYREIYGSSFFYTRIPIFIIICLEIQKNGFKVELFFEGCVAELRFLKKILLPLNYLLQCSYNVITLFYAFKSNRYW